MKMFGDPMELAGGHAIRYNNMLTIDLTKVSIQKGDPYFDIKDQCMRIRVKVLKNHCCPTKNPYVSVDYTVIIGKGTDTKGEIVQAAFDLGIAEKGGAWIRIYPEGVEHEKGNELVLENGDVCKFNGMSAYMEYLDNHEELFEYIKNRVENNNCSTLVQSLSEEEIKELKNEEQEEQEFMDSLEDALSEDAN